jgi:hypothetical protein
LVAARDVIGGLAQLFGCKKSSKNELAARKALVLHQDKARAFFP